jgi:hypothetical protein
MKRFPERQNVQKVILLFGFLFLLWGAARTEGRLDAVTRAASEEDIREAVLRYQMEDWIRNGDKGEAEAKDQTEKEIAHHLNFKIFFIETNEKDPTDDFMKRFHDIPRILKKSSGAEIAKVMRMPVVDKETQERGIIFSADRVRWQGKNHVKVAGGYHCDGLCGAGFTFEVRFENGKWMVKKERMNWIS